MLSILVDNFELRAAVVLESLEVSRYPHFLELGTSAAVEFFQIPGQLDLDQRGAIYGENLD